MGTLLKRYIIFIFFVCRFCCCRAYGENLALGRSYSFLPRPNYTLCTDGLDSVQLTDGRVYGSWWGNKSTVGWQMPEPAVEIVIDFEQWVLIDQVKVYSVGGGLSDVEFPEFIAVLVSNDGKTYGFAGLISSEDLANLRSDGHNRVPHTFIIGNLYTQGRFVKIVVRPNRRYFFLDEIEIIGNKSKLGGQTGRREDLPQFTDSSKVLRAIEDYQQLRVNIVESIKALQDYTIYA